MPSSWEKKDGSSNAALRHAMATVLAIDSTWN